MKKRLVLFHGELNTLNVFSDQLRLEFEALGYEILIFDLKNSMQSLGMLYAELQKCPITAMIGFNNTLFGLKTASGVNVWEELGIPCINILVDHPYWYGSILRNSPSNCLVLCVDRNHMNFVNRFYPTIEMNGFLAHGGTVGAAEICKMTSRTIDVMYAGSLLIKYIDKPDFSKWSFDARGVCEATIAYLLEHPEETIEDTLEKQLKEAQVQLQEQELCAFISDCVYIERIVSSHFREKIMRTIAEAGIHLELYGEGWEDCEWISLPNVNYKGLISPEEVLEKMDDTRIVLNTFPWFKDGSHERIFNGMLRGCVIASDYSGYLQEIMPDDLWCGFSLAEEDIAALPARIKALLADEEKLQKMSDAGYRFALEGHTWQQRARELHEDVLKYL